MLTKQHLDKSRRHWVKVAVAVATFREPGENQSRRPLGDFGNIMTLCLEWPLCNLLDPFWAPLAIRRDRPLGFVAHFPKLDHAR
jgi:hypothetical protein